MVAVLTRRILLLSLVAGLLCVIAFTWRWQLMVDSPIMHYVDFLMSRGLAPYRQIQDNNLPGAYLAEWVGMHVFGPDDLAWRLFEFAELAVGTAAMVFIARPYDWAAGLFAGALFTILHGAEGPYFSGEREIAMTAVILCGYAALFAAVRYGRPALMAAMGFLCAFAVAIKPTVVLLPLLLLLFTVLVLRKRGRRWIPYALWALAGMALAVVLNVGFLLQHGALLDFFRVQQSISTYYAQLAALTLPQMVKRLFFQPVFDVLLVTSLLLLKGNRWQTWEETWEWWALLGGGLLGVLSYILQRKNFVHHRYLYLELGFLLAGMLLLPALRRTGWQRALAIAVTLAIALVAVPTASFATARFKGNSDLTVQMESDLRSLGSRADLQRGVLCLDQVFGCINALYHLRLVENTPLSGDLLLFTGEQLPVTEHARNLLWTSQQNSPANVVIVTNENFQGPNNYGRLQRWPAYDAFLMSNYRLLTSRTFPCEFGRRDDEPDHLYGYRIYVRNGTSFAQGSAPPALPRPCP